MQDVWIVAPDKADERSRIAMAALVTAMSRQDHLVSCPAARLRLHVIGMSSHQVVHAGSSARMKAGIQKATGWQSIPFLKSCKSEFACGPCAAGDRAVCATGYLAAHCVRRLAAAAGARPAGLPAAQQAAVPGAPVHQYPADASVRSWQSSCQWHSRMLAQAHEACTGPNLVS